MQATSVSMRGVVTHIGDALLAHMGQRGFAIFLKRLEYLAIRLVQMAFT